VRRFIVKQDVDESVGTVTERIGGASGLRGRHASTQR